MFDNATERAPRDLERVNISEGWEIRWWSTKLAVTQDQPEGRSKKIVQVDGRRLTIRCRERYAVRMRVMALSTPQRRRCTAIRSTFGPVTD